MSYDDRATTVEQVAVLRNTLEFLIQKVTDLDKKLDTVVDKMKAEFVSAALFQTLEARTKKLEEAKTWTDRIIIGAVILSMLGLVLSRVPTFHP